MRYPGMIAASAVVLLAAIGTAEAGVRELALADATKIEQEQPHNLDLSKVLMARLDIAGRTVDVVSLSPSRLGIDEKAHSSLWFSADKKSLHLLTISLPEGRGWELVLPVAELKTGFHFSFPFADDSGTAKASETKLLDFLSKP